MDEFWTDAEMKWPMTERVEENQWPVSQLQCMGVRVKCVFLGWAMAVKIQIWEVFQNSLQTLVIGLREVDEEIMKNIDRQWKWNEKEWAEVDWERHLQTV